MAFSNGYAPLSLLDTVAPGCQLLSPVARAFDHLVLIGKMYGISIHPVSTYGSGYRNFQVQGVFYRASLGSRVDALKAGLDPHLRVSVAAPGGSRHGWADRVDVLFNGRSPDADDLALAHRYGFVQEFGSDDRNHLAHDHRTAVNGVRAVDKYHFVARYLNNRHLGRSTNTEHTGHPDSDFYWLVQHYGHLIHHYPAACREDGITGHYTEIAIEYLWDVVKSGH